MQVNTEIVSMQRVRTPAGASHLRGLIEAHAAKTGSAKAKKILAGWDAALPQFWQIVPPAEKNTPEVNPDVLQEVKETAGNGKVEGKVAVPAS